LTQYDIEETSVSKSRTSISLNTDIEDFSISKNAPSISVYDIEAFVLRYRISCSSISVFFCWIQPGLPTRYWTQIAVCTLHCPGRPQPPQRRLHSAARPHPLHRAQHRAQPPERRSGRLGRRSGGRSLRSGHQRSAGACDFSRQELTGAKFAAAGAAAAAAGAGINETQERVILRDKKSLAPSLE
jgi:hypothetical protein